MAGKSELEKTIRANTALSLILFTTEWNGACQIVTMIFEELTRSYTSRINFIRVDQEKEAAIGRKYGISEVPAILFLKDGKVIDHTVGLISKNTLASKIEIALSEPS
jgi:thioredoxin 1